MSGIKRSPGLGSWRYHSLNIPGGDLDFAVKRESLSDTQWTQAWPLCGGGGLLCCMWTAESHFLILILNEAGHSLFTSEKWSLWEGCWHVYPVGLEPARRHLLFLVLPLCFPTSSALRWPDIKSCRSGCQGFKGPSQVYTKARLFSAWMETPVASRHREPSLASPNVSLVPSGWRRNLYFLPSFVQSKAHWIKAPSRPFNLPLPWNCPCHFRVTSASGTN